MLNHSVGTMKSYELMAGLIIFVALVGALIGSMVRRQEPIRMTIGRVGKDIGHATNR